MNDLGRKLADKRKDLGLTQIEFAERMSVTRQTVSRWEAGTAMPDIDKIADIASILGVSCDYLLRDDAAEESPTPAGGISRLLRSVGGRDVRLAFYDGEADPDLYDKSCRVLEFEGMWAKIEAQTRKGRIEKLIPMSSVLSVEVLEASE